MHAACSDPALVVHHPVLFLMRSDAASMYHHWEDVPALLTALWLLPGVQQAVQEQGLQVGWRAGCCRQRCMAALLVGQGQDAAAGYSTPPSSTSC